MKIKHQILPPNLTNNPSWDVIVTRQIPLLSFFNSKGGPLKRHYEIQLDTSKSFNSGNLIAYPLVPENGEFITDKKVEEKDTLKDKNLYFWRVRTITSHGKSHWAVTEPAEEFKVIAASSYIQAQKSTRRLIYGEQFHAEIKASYNHGRPFIKNFLELAMKKRK